MQIKFFQSWIINFLLVVQLCETMEDLRHGSADREEYLLKYATELAKPRSSRGEHNAEVSVLTFFFFFPFAIVLCVVVPSHISTCNDDLA